jgi:hypothetical protein
MFGRREMIENRSEEPESSDEMEYRLEYVPEDKMFYLVMEGTDKVCGVLSEEYMIELILADREEWSGI